MKKPSRISQKESKKATNQLQVDWNKDLSRRRLLRCSSGCVCAAVCVPRESMAEPKPINIGSPDEFEVDTISEKFIRHNFFVIRRKKRLYAIAATCPHEKNYLFKAVSDPKRLSCTGHEAYFDLEGGPVKKGLVRFAVSYYKKGHVPVDPYTKFPENKWKNKKSFVEMK